MLTGDDLARTRTHAYCAVISADDMLEAAIEEGLAEVTTAWNQSTGDRYGLCKHKAP